MSQELLDFDGAHFPWMPQMMKSDEAPDPEEVCSLGAPAVVQIADLLDQLIEKPNRPEWLTRRSHKGATVFRPPRESSPRCTESTAFDRLIGKRQVIRQGPGYL